MPWLTPLVQDILATLLAAAAFAVLVRRTAGMFFTKDESPGCDGCSACPTPVEPRDVHAAAPLVLLRRSPSSDSPGRG